jgi:hypothetical protein
MNTLNILLPYEYASEIIRLNWSDIFFAIKQRFMTPDAAIDHAIMEVSQVDNPPKAAVELACLLKGESVHPYIDELANEEGNSNNDSVREKILFLALNWVYNHKELYEEPLEAVEIIYADFNYPEEIANFVRYMPSEQPPLASAELNRERLYRNWKDYLNKKAQSWK